MRKGKLRLFALAAMAALTLPSCGNAAKGNGKGIYQWCHWQSSMAKEHFEITDYAIADGCVEVRRAKDGKWYLLALDEHVCLFSADALERGDNGNTKIYCPACSTEIWTNSKL